MPQYMLLLYDNPTDWQKVSPEEMQKALEKYSPGRGSRSSSTASAWRTMPGRSCVGRAARQTTDGPYSEAKEVLGGYYTIEAANYDEAVGLAQDHPHLDYGGVLVIRQTWTA